MNKLYENVLSGQIDISELVKKEVLDDRVLEGATKALKDAKKLVVRLDKAIKKEDEEGILDVMEEFRLLQTIYKL